MKKDEDRVYKKNPNIVSRIIDNDTILVPIARQIDEVECIYTLNESGAYVWGKIDGKNKLGQIARGLSEEYGISQERASGDIEDIIKDLFDADCIKEAK